jgi:receptor protein-tyrosine kinase
MEAVLAGSAPLASVCARTDYPSLDVFLTGPASQNAHELVVGEPLPAVVRELSAAYHVVVFDSSPVLPVPDAALIAAHVECCVPVVRAGQTRRACVEAALALLPGDRVAGFFLAEARRGHPAPSSEPS